METALEEEIWCSGKVKEDNYPCARGSDNQDCIRWASPKLSTKISSTTPTSGVQLSPGSKQKQKAQDDSNAALVKHLKVKKAAANDQRVKKV